VEARDRDVIAAMIQRIDGLNDKVDDLLLYARPKPPRLQLLDLGPLLREVAANAHTATGREGPPIGITGAEGVSVHADPDMLRGALLNLTMNACQAAQKSDVQIHVAASGVCSIFICDRGGGIPSEIRDRVFEPFFTTRAGGTGLGLAIVRRLLELQEGSVALNDRPGGGTIAKITIPLAPR
jgi:signal transduction histidine kinase